MAGIYKYVNCIKNFSFDFICVSKLTFFYYKWVWNLDLMQRMDQFRNFVVFKLTYRFDNTLRVKYWAKQINNISKHLIDIRVNFHSFTSVHLFVVATMVWFSLSTQA